MIEEFEYRGQWWIPSNQERKISGVLRFNQDDGTLLILDGSFTEATQPLVNPQIINGISSVGNKITLSNCVQLYRGDSYDGRSSSRFYVRYVFVDAHLCQQEDIKFHGIAAYYPSLKWLWSMDLEIDDGDEEMKIRYKPPKPLVEMNIAKYDLNISLGFSSSRSLYGVYLEQRFLACVHAVESYHRRTMKNEEMSQKDHAERLKSILDSTPPKHKKWLEDKLAYSNEPSLRKRLKETIDDHTEAIGSLIGDKKFFIDKVVSTRNYLTHYDDANKSGTAKDSGMVKVTEKLKMLIEACLLSELAFSQSDIRRFLTDRYYYVKTLPR